MLDGYRRSTRRDYRNVQVIGYSGSTLLRSDFAGLTGNITTIDIQDSPELQTVPADAFDEFTKSGVT